MRALPLMMMSAALLAGCVSTPPTATQSLPLSATDTTRQLAEVKDNLDAADRMNAPPPAAVAASEVRPLKGLGFAQIAGQPGKTQNEKRLMAIRAARMDALRDLTEQVHGIRISASTTVRDAVVQDDSLSAVVQGTLRGARTVAYIVRALKGRV